MKLMSTNKENYKKALKFGLLFYAIFMGLSGTISFAVLLLWVVPKDQISSIIAPLLFIALFLYGSCAISILIRSKINKK
ncbi:hypothetical protein [Peribacillus frigoritolerans]|uniref:hypothetical protein n=1 Tax=Peribacillus castrilensis TaxID=2897690 RepID=UPI002DCDA1FD|nr:hypothetical protein [Peribacillus castrilensis]